MQRITNTEEFVVRSNEIYHNKFDYSLTKYVKSSENVKIICPIHGVFEQTPNKHLQGRGCKLCNRVEKLKARNVAFINEVKLVHGDKYDYSKVDYTTSPDGLKVCIICPEHGEFWQTRSCHILQKQDCPRCAAKAGGLKRTGENNVAHRKDVKDKRRKTCQKRYGTNTWAESDEGRQRLHNIVTSDEVSSKMIATCQERYDANMWSQSVEGKEKLHKIMGSAEMKAKVVSGYMNSYGVEHYMKTSEGREKARINILLPERQKKIHDTMFEKYGVYSFLESDVFKSNIKQYLKKSWKTKHKNGTFNTSKPEQTMRLMLKRIFGEDDVLYQYNSDRYPFNCDFYIKSLDLYIELNASWTHGGHFFDENNPDDIIQLDEWKTRAREKGSRYYHSAIDTWTYRDLLKLQTALDNNLNYLVFWRNDLTDFRNWLELQNLI